MAGKTHQDRELAAEVRSLVLEEVKEVLQGDDEEYKKAVIMKMCTSVLPRLNEVTGDGGEELKIVFDNAFSKASQKTKGDS